MTERLYYTDSYLKEFNAKVIQTGEIEGRPAVVLDKTLFYPESGGQMFDTGIIENVSVCRVVLKENVIWHVLDKPVSKKDIHGQINWVRRFDFMQQHTGFHILAGSFLHQLEVETLSSHLGEEYSTIDVRSDRIDAAQLKDVEDHANKIIWENRPVRAFWAEKEDMDNPLLRKVPDEFEKVRLVEIENYDLDPCGGTHVRNTGEVGLVKILGSEKIRGNTRYVFVAGNRALREMQKQYNILTTLCQQLTTGVDDMPAAVKKLLEENKNYIKALQNFEKLGEEKIVSELLTENKTSKIVVKNIEDKKIDGLRRIASTVIKNGHGTFLLGSTGETPCLVFATTDEKLDLRPVFQQVLPLIDGRGGGSVSFVQGGGTNSAGVPEALEKARGLLG
ncbi:hypothetical protein JXQ31_09275 [candidate division KSB1 bacterium]|nr:hypothetical protein [candidate division KSB1 bacterium]